MYVYTQVALSLVKDFLVLSTSHLILYISHGELAQLARASALQAEGQGFEPLILQKSSLKKIEKETYTEKILIKGIFEGKARVS